MYSIVYYISKQTKNLGDDWSPLQTESIFASVSKLPTTLYCTIVILFFIGCYHAMKDYSIYDIALPRLICFLHKKEKEVTVKKYAFLIVLFFSLSSQLDQTPFFPNFPSSNPIQVLSQFRNRKVQFCCSYLWVLFRIIPVSCSKFISFTFAYRKM